MDYSLNNILIISYIALTLLIGIYYGRNKKNIREYAVGNKNFSDLAIFSTLIATNVSGSGLLLISSEIYKNGTIYLLVVAGMILGNILIAKYIAPRMTKFNDCISTGDMFAKYYGNTGRYLSGMAGLFVASGAIAMQLKVMGYIISYFFAMDVTKATIYSSLIVIFYSAYGGIRAVIYTDILQFLTIAITLPLIFLLAVNQVNGFDIMATKVAQGELQFFGPDVNIIKEYLPYIILACLPIFLTPVIYQRLLIAKNINQTKKAFKYTAYTLIPYFLLSAGIGLLVLIFNNQVPADDVFIYMVDNYLPQGFRVVAIICVIALVMSTVDSNMNVMGITIAHDLLNNHIRNESYKLIIMRLSILVLSLLSMKIALKYQSLIDILLYMSSFWGPVMAPALFLSIFGFYTSVKIFLTAALLGVITLFGWQYYELQQIYILNNVIMATFVNLFCLFYLDKIFMKKPSDIYSEKY